MRNKAHKAHVPPAEPLVNVYEESGDGLEAAAETKEGSSFPINPQ